MLFSAFVFTLSFAYFTIFTKLSFYPFLFSCLFPTSFLQIRGHYFAKLDPLNINITNLDGEGAWLKQTSLGMDFRLLFKNANHFLFFDSEC